MPVRRAPPTQQQVTEAFRALADEHAREREPLDKRRAWYALQYESRMPRAAMHNARVRWALAVTVFALGILVGAPAWQAWTKLRYDAHGLATEGSNLRAGDVPAGLAFSDGSRVMVSPRSRLSVEFVGKHSALTRLIDGRLHVAVHHEPDTNYRFLAGPYEVQVVGTEFDLEWRAQAEGFTLVMQSGEVRVLGEGSARRVSAGQTLRLPGQRPPAAEPTKAVPSSSARQPPVAASVVASVRPVSKAANVLGQQSAGGVAPSARSDWRELLDSGQFSAIVRDADARGNESVLSTAPASDLRVLALAARYTGRRALSLRAWQALRDRYATEARTQGAAFFLGRCYEEQGDGAQALHWLARYLSESPSGAFAGEALGHRFLLLSKSGQRAEAASSAREYLERYPRGAYAKSARIVAQPE